MTTLIELQNTQKTEIETDIETLVHVSIFSIFSAVNFSDFLRTPSNTVANAALWSLWVLYYVYFCRHVSSDKCIFFLTKQITKGKKAEG